MWSQGQEHWHFLSGFGRAALVHWLACANLSGILYCLVRAAVLRGLVRQDALCFWPSSSISIWCTRSAAFTGLTSTVEAASALLSVPCRGNAVKTTTTGS